MFHGFFTAADLFFQIDQMLFDGQKLLIDGVLTGYTGILGKIAPAFITGKGNNAAVCLHFTDNDTQKRSLAGTVDADNGGFFIIFYMKRAVL